MAKQLASETLEGGATSQLSFQTFFHAATGNSPYGYQCRLGCGEQSGCIEAEWLTSGTACHSQLINIPTGLGKTAAVVLAWLWNRVHLQKSEWPCRLVYCLPMRTLVEQTEKEVRRWILRLVRKHTKPRDKSELRWLALHSPIILMGGEELTKKKREWDIYPERPAILIGTQDMLLSRALNRGYGMSRYRWPMHFGLLNNDCLWVMDETQLMGVGVETSAQLDGFRHDGKMPSFGACPTWWMSATLEDSRLDTVDHLKPDGGWPVEKLSEAEQTSGRPHDLITAPKKLSQAALKDAPAPLTLNSATKDYAAQFAKLVKERHQTGTLTLVVVNRVARAREIYKALTIAEKKSKQPLYDPTKVALIHSRFRPVDRERHTKLLFGNKDGKGDRIVIATQAVEAGVDVSARLLITELAPWSSLVQRMGRCNRRADISDAEVVWVDIKPKDANDDLLLPYSETDLSEARKALGNVTNASPMALREIKILERPVIRPVIRRRDLVDLFDTTPDICGQDLDISRYIRDGEDNDVQFFWRNIDEGETPNESEPQPSREELCRVSIGEATKFLKSDKVRAWRWNPLERKWESAKAARPGAVYLIAASSGGYEDALGWTGEVKVSQLTIHRLPDEDSDSHDGNASTFTGEWLSLERHTQDVVTETRRIAAEFNLSTNESAALLTAALWHDAGKAHQIFQEMITRGGDVPADKKSEFQAKSDKFRGGPMREGKSCKGFRHELASALAWLLADTAHAPGKPGSRERDLVAYLIAAHHGKVRLSIRSLPDEKGNPDAPEALFARGIWQGDKLPPVSLGELKTPEITLDFSFMQMGEGPHGPSWLARTIALRDQFGPFRLAFLETLLRAADARASARKDSAQ